MRQLLQNFVDTPLAGMLGWALLHSLWEGAIISAILAAVLAAVRTSRSRYATACAAMMAMLGGFCLTLFQMIPARTSGLHSSRAFGTPAWNILPDNNAPVSWNPSLAAIAPWLGSFWVTGVLLFCLWRLAGWVSAQRLRSRGVCCASDHWQNELARLSARLRISRPVRLLESCLAEVPMLLGHFRPVILMPLGLLSGLPSEQIEAILLHELAHVRRYDYVVNVMQRLAESLFFYHPAAWWISKVIRAEREYCCDDVVVSITGNAHEYALALAALEQNRLSGREPAIAATGGHLTKRIHRLLHPGRAIGSWVPLLAVAVFLVTAAVSLTALPRKTLQNTSSDTQAQSAAAPASSYPKWHDEDVVYIIEDAEHAAFLKLTTNEERDQFIRQFWERRNPTPGSPQNTFKEEHYRRLTFANLHFQTASGTPGWRTDRGHMYIVYGPPDQIEAHPKGSQKPFATEVWFYSHIAGLGDNTSLTFIDTSGRGDFHLAPGSALTPDHPRQDPLSKDATIPECLYCPTPQYSEEARAAHLQGTVVLRATITPDGRATNIIVVKSFGHGLDEKAIEAASSWKFKPAYDKSGRAVPATVPIQITFNLNPNPQPAPPLASQPGTKYIVDDLQIEGNVHDRDGVRGRVLAKAEHIESDNPQKLVVELLEVAIRGDFQDRGYFKVVVLEPTWEVLDVKDGKQRVRIIVPITEGPQYRVGIIKFQNETGANIPTETLRAQFHLNTEDLFNVSEIRAGIERIGRLFSAKGFGSAAVEPTTAIDDSRGVVDTSFRIFTDDPQPRPH